MPGSATGYGKNKLGTNPSSRKATKDRGHKGEFKVKRQKEKLPDGLPNFYPSICTQNSVFYCLFSIDLGGGFLGWEYLGLLRAFYIPFAL